MRIIYWLTDGLSKICIRLGNFIEFEIADRLKRIGIKLAFYEMDTGKYDEQECEEYLKAREDGQDMQ